MIQTAYSPPRAPHFQRRANRRSGLVAKATSPPRGRVSNLGDLTFSEPVVAWYREIMDALRQRALTWLFYAAATCVFVASVFREGEIDDWNAVVLLGGSYIGGAAPALSKRRWLPRAAMLLTVIAVVEVMILWSDGPKGEAIALVAAMIVAPFLTASVTRGMMSLGTDRRRTDGVAWRFSVMELLAWMLIVAIASAGLRFADLGSLLHWTGESAYWLHGAAAGVVAALFLTPERRCDRMATVATTALVLTMTLVVPRYVNDWLADDGLMWWVQGFVMYWVVVRRLDEGAAIRPASSPPQPTLALVSPATDHTTIDVAV
jgi:hypothetical protein